MKIRWKSLLLNLTVPLAVGGTSALLTRDGMKGFQQMRQPPLSPPQWAFPVAWTALYLMMGLSTYYVVTASGQEKEKRSALTLYGIQLALNFFWSIFFFNLEWFLFAFFWLLLLWAAVFALYKRYLAISDRAGKLLIPYLIWLTFATYLCLGVWWLNR